MDDNDIKYYTIGEVSDILGIRESTLRYWQKEFDELNPQRTKTNRRLFTKEDITIIKKIYHLRNNLKYTIAGAKEEIAKDPEILNIVNNSNFESIKDESKKFEIKKDNSKTINNKPKNQIDNKKEIEKELLNILKILDEEN